MTVEAPASKCNPDQFQLTVHIDEEETKTVTVSRAVPPGVYYPPGRAFFLGEDFITAGQAVLDKLTALAQQGQERAIVVTINTSHDRELSAAKQLGFCNERFFTLRGVDYKMLEKPIESRYTFGRKA